MNKGTTGLIVNVEERLEAVEHAVVQSIAIENVRDAQEAWRFHVRSNTWLQCSVDLFFHIQTTKGLKEANERSLRRADRIVRINNGN